MEGVDKAQITQEKIDGICVKIISSPTSSEAFKPQILINNTKERTSLAMQVYIQYVDGIEKSVNGKFRSVLSKIK